VNSSQLLLPLLRTLNDWRMMTTTQMMADAVGR